jgi:hypothetical protein
MKFCEPRWRSSSRTREHLTNTRLLKQKPVFEAAVTLDLCSGAGGSKLSRATSHADLSFRSFSQFIPSNKSGYLCDYSDFFLSPPRPVRIWSPPVQWVAREANHSPKPTVDVKKVWYYTPTPSYVLCCGVVFNLAEVQSLHNLLKLMKVQSSKVTRFVPFQILYHHTLFSAT